MIPAYLIAIGFAAATLIKWHGKQYEHALTRFLLFWTYVYIESGLPIEQARGLSRWFVLLLPVIEILSWLIRKWWHRGNS